MAKILLVDDSWVARLGMSKLLSPYGHTILEASNGVEGLTLMQNHTPDLVFLDLLMPEKDGLSVLMDLGPTPLAFKIVILSADIQATTRERCFFLGALDFISKPPKNDEIKRVLEAFL